MMNDAPGCNLNERANDGATPLILAAQRGMMEVMRALVAKGVDLEVVDRDTKTALIHVTQTTVKHGEGAAIYLVQEAGKAWEIAGGARVGECARAVDFD